MLQRGIVRAINKTEFQTWHQIIHTVSPVTTRQCSNCWGCVLSAMGQMAFLYVYVGNDLQNS